jgi:phosphate-selective porin OprO/OprP
MGVVLIQVLVAIVTWVPAAPDTAAVSAPSYQASLRTGSTAMEAAPATGSQNVSGDEQATAKPKKKKAKHADPHPTGKQGSDEAATVAGAQEGLHAMWKERPVIRYGTLFRLDINAMFQEDARASYAGATDLDPFELGRKRLGIQGSVFKHVDYEVERELTEKDVVRSKVPKSPWKDVYVNVSVIKNAQIQAGRFKIPFGLDQLTSIRNHDYVYRSLGATYLAPARDIGAMVHGRFFRHGLTYWAGMFAHDGENARSSKIRGGNDTIAARVTGRPFRPLGLDALELGTAFTLSSVADDWLEPNGLRGRTVMTDDTFFHAVYVKGHRRRWEADVDWTAGPAAARAEYTRVGDQRLQQGIGDEDLPAARAQSWYVSGSWVLTGESKQRPLRPEHPFLHGGAGALEIVGRYERLWFDSAGTDLSFRNPRAEHILPSGDRVLTIGVNWILNRWVKLQINGIRERVEDAERSPVPNGAAFWSRVFRVQFAL